jgi:hypothetical protein
MDPVLRRGGRDLIQVASHQMERKTQHKTYTTRLLKGGALLEDMRMLVRSWNDGGNDKQKERVIIENVLGKKTRMRAGDIYRRAFLHRFLKGDPPDAWKIVRPLEDREVPVEILRPVYLWITARSEPLLYDYTAEEILSKNRSQDLSVRVDETATWIRKRVLEQHQSWTDTVTTKVARGLLATLRDFGILVGSTTKRVAPVYLPVESFAYLAFVLHELGSSGERLIRHQDWKLFLMESPVVERLFLDAHQHRLLRYEAAGKIHRIDFSARNTEEMADVIAGRRD